MSFPTSNLSQENILRDVHDADTQTLRTSATAIIAPGLEVDISHTNDSIRVGDGTSLVTSTAVSGKQGLDVNIVNSGLPVSFPSSLNAYPLEKGLTKNTYNEVTSVASGILTTIASYTVPSGKNGFFTRTEFSGTNIATFDVRINGSVQDKKRTNYAVSLNESSIFNSSGNTGIPVTAGDVIIITVIHDRPAVGDFNARIEIIEV